jgi:hypothetical protein
VCTQSTSTYLDSFTFLNNVNEVQCQQLSLFQTKLSPKQGMLALVLPFWYCLHTSCTISKMKSTNKSTTNLNGAEALIAQ